MSADENDISGARSDGENAMLILQQNDALFSDLLGDSVALFDVGNLPDYRISAPDRVATSAKVSSLPFAVKQRCAAIPWFRLRQAA